MKYQTGLIKKPQPADDRYFGDVNTRGIIEVVLYADPKSADYTRAFARTLKAAKLFDTCKNIYDFVKTQIPYVLDKQGYQLIKSPGRLWAEKSGDCKSFSVFIASCLKNLGIRYGYRFASYDPNDPTPTHVYVYVPVEGNRDIILDAVWSGPFNTQKQFDHKQDFLMAKTSYLGASGGHIPGVLKINTPIDQLTDGELDLLLARQRLEIKKMNAGIAGIGNYDEALKTIDHCIRNVGNPAVIIDIGEALEEGYSLEEAISGLGASAKKQEKKAAKAQKKKETGKTGAGRFLQKVGKGLEKAGKAVLKVATAPLRLVAKGAMELYLPKAAPFFLYLFAPNPDTLPDMMKRKRKKAEKFKNFVVKGIGMKETHFMQIISNNLEKRYGKPPAQYLAEKLITRVSGIGNPKARERAYMAGIGGPGAKEKKAARKAATAAKKQLAPKAVPNYNTTVKSPIDTTYAAQAAAQAVPLPAEMQAQPAKKFNLDAGKLVEAGEKLASGNIIGAAMGAITWLIQKISALFKGEKMDPITPDDFPDVERDAANAFEYKDMVQDFSNLNYQQQDQVKQVAADLIAQQNRGNIWEAMEQQLPFLNTAQKQEVYEEIEEGPEAIDNSEGQQLAAQIDSETKGDNTALIALAAVAALALVK